MLSNSEEQVEECKKTVNPISVALYRFGGGGGGQNRLMCLTYSKYRFSPRLVTAVGKRLLSLVFVI